MKRIFLTLIFFYSFASYTQIRPTIYSGNYLGASVGFKNKLSTEIRIKTNSFENYFLDSKDVTPFSAEFSVLYTTLKKEYYTLRLGIGTSFIFENTDPLNSFIFPVNFEITPFKRIHFLLFPLFLNPRLFHI